MIVKFVEHFHNGVQSHTLSRYAIGYVVRGTKYIYNGDKRQTISKGDVFFLGIGTHYTEEVPDESNSFEQILFYYQPADLHKILMYLNLTYGLNISYHHACPECQGANAVSTPAWQLLKGFFSNTANYLRGVAKLREAKMREIAETAQEVGRQQTLLAARKLALDSTRRKIDAQRARYERDQHNAKTRLQRMSTREKAVLREKEQQEQRLDNAIAELQKLTKGNKTGASFSTRTSNLNLPVAGGHVKRYKENMAEIVGPQGARITAIYEGKVVDVKRNRITNRFDVYIAHGEYITSYANLNAVNVAKGQTVPKNGAIGVIGPSVDLQTMKTEYRLVFGIYPPAGGKKMRASDCFRK